MPKIAILMYGLNRGVHTAFPSVQEKILNVLTKNNMQYDIYVHTYKLKGLYSNIRNHEKNLQIDPYEIETVVNPINMIIDDQDEIDRLHDITDYNKHGDCWNNGYVSTWNLIRALYSLKCVWKLIETKPYDGVMVVRPDVLFLNELNITHLLNAINDDNIYVPSFHPIFHESNDAYNDRFAFGSKQSMTKYCTRYDYMKEYAAMKKLCSEHFLKYVIKTAKGTNILFNRVRANGQVGRDCTI